MVSQLSQPKKRKHLTKAELLISKHSETGKNNIANILSNIHTRSSVKVNQDLILQARAEHQVSGGNWHSFCKFHSYYSVGLDNYGQNYYHNYYDQYSDHSH